MLLQELGPHACLDGTELYVMLSGMARVGPEPAQESGCGSWLSAEGRLDAAEVEDSLTCCGLHASGSVWYQAFYKML